MPKIEDAISIITQLGFPRPQQNERSALCLLALINLDESGNWNQLESPKIGIRAILDFSRNVYNKPYAENSRESFRKETMHQFVEAGFALQNPDNPDRAPNSPKWCYQISPAALNLLKNFGTTHWENSLKNYLSNSKSLSEKYRMKRKISMVSCELPDGQSLKMSPGAHSELIRDIIQDFLPRFAPGSKVLYVGDTGNKGVIHNEKLLAAIGVKLHERGKMPDVIALDKKNNWLLLIESVTSTGPVDGKRHGELTELFSTSKIGVVFVTAFPNRALMARFASTISWESEVWIADNPDHMIHFNGDRYLGPH